MNYELIATKTTRSNKVIETEKVNSNNDLLTLLHEMKNYRVDPAITSKRVKRVKLTIISNNRVVAEHQIIYNNYLQRWCKNYE